MEINKEFLQNKKIIFLIIIITLGICLRLFHFNTPFSHDEWYTYDIVARNLTSMNSQMYDDVHMPLYFYMAKLYTSIFELTRANLKFFSVIFGILGIFAFYFFVKKYFGEKNSIVSTAILCLSVFHISYSQTARMYSPLFLFSVLCLYFLFEIIFENRKRSIYGYFISNILALYTHFFGLFLILFETFVLYKFRKNIQDKKRIIIGNLILFLSLIPFILFMLIQILRKINGTSYAAWMPKTTLTDIYIGISALSSNHIITPLFIVLITYFMYKQAAKMLKKQDTDTKKEILFYGVIICFIIPSLITFITPIFAWRYYAIFFPIFIIIISEEILSIPVKKINLRKIALILTFSLLLLSSLVYLAKMKDNEYKEEQCKDFIREKIKEYEKNNTYFITYRWLNEWVPNHKPITGAVKEFEKEFDINVELINYYNTSIDHLFDNYSYVMAISPSGLNNYFIKTNKGIILNQSQCVSESSEKIFFYKYHYYIYALNETTLK